MRELNQQEMDEASGGIVPLIGFAVALAGHLSGVTGVTTWAISSVGLIAGTYSAAQYLHDRKE